MKSLKHRNSRYYDHTFSKQSSSGSVKNVFLFKFQHNSELLSILKQKRDDIIT